jgi:group I intron endonuclease
MDTQKRDITRENKGKCGIYRIINNESGKCYVGSSINLTVRFYMYFNLYHITNRKDSVICRALLKYGYSKFSLEILEYCSPEIVIKREQYYIDLYKPEYNVLKVAGSSLGRKISEAAKAKISAAKLGVKPSSVALIKLRAHLAELNLSKALKVKVVDLTTNDTTIYDTQAATALNCSTTTISLYDKKLSLENNIPFRKRYLIKIIR